MLLQLNTLVLSNSRGGFLHQLWAPDAQASRAHSLLWLSPHFPLPGAVLQCLAVIRVLPCRYARFVNPVEYQQAFTAEEGRLCICCMAPVTACSAKKAAVLEGAKDLFCG